ncbi:hypothetical protein C8R44DRAFT_992181 [Mycena epipterygia]|nr:hypothetical protein C8R44DRAFT_992181 [Mycena epipterygia]
MPMTFAKFASDCCSVCLSCCACCTIFGNAAALKFFCPCIKHEGIDDDEDDTSMDERAGVYATAQPTHRPVMDSVGDSRR